MSSTILVTGATGSVSTATLQALAARGNLSIRAGVLPGAPRTDALLLAGVTPVDFDFTKPETFGPALAGVDTVFLLTPFTEDQVALGTALLDAARASRVKRVVKFSSSLGEETVAGRWHRALERHATQTGIPLTILRASFFFQNFINYHPPQPDGAIYLPWGTGRASFVDVRDLGELAAVVLTERGHEGKTYRLTGPEALGAQAMAAAIGSATQREIRYVDVPEDAARKAMSGLGMPDWLVDAMLGLHGAIKAGTEADVTPDAARLLGKPLRTANEFARDFAAAWKA